MLGLLLTTQAAAKHFDEGGSIINIGSVVSRKIRVNALNPGMVETEGTHTAGFIGSAWLAGEQFLAGGGVR